MSDQKEYGLTPELCHKVLRTCGSFNLRRASRVVSQLYDDILQPTGLRSTQVVLLVAIAAEQELSLAHLARELVLSPSTLSRNLRPLERDGLVDIHETGKRGKLVRLTNEGERALTNAVPYWERAQDKFTSLVGSAAWTNLAKRLSKTVQVTRG